MSHAVTAILPNAGGRQYPGLVAPHGVSCRLLLAPELAVKGHIQAAAVMALIPNGRANIKVG